MRAAVLHRLRQGGVLAGVQFGQVQAVCGPQQGLRDQRRAGVGVGPVVLRDLVQGGDVGVIRGKGRPQLRDPRRRLAGLRGFGGGEVIEAAPRVRLDIAERFVLLGEIGQHPRQQAVLVHIREVSGVVEMLVGQHVCGIAGAGTARNGPGAVGCKPTLRPVHRPTDAPRGNKAACGRRASACPPHRAGALAGLGA